ncbi:hypothetical protein [Paenibacillus sp. E194]|uniref:hypothetical protein n=1 Tax=Paenibacillus sp. E194 TaxID=1458845 RepID=UPI003FA5CD14
MRGSKQQPTTLSMTCSQASQNTKSCGEALRSSATSTRLYGMNVLETWSVAISGTRSSSTSSGARKSRFRSLTWTKTQESLLNLTLNKVEGRWDDEALARLLDELQAETADLGLTGFVPMK